MTTYVIVGAGDVSPGELMPPENAFIIAADGGLSHLEAAGIVPNLIMGDFDSLGRVPEGENVIAHQPEKDDTDTMLAVKEALTRGAETIIIYGGLGGRLDHSLANLQTLAYISKQGKSGFLVGCGNICTTLTDEGISFSQEENGIISVFSLGDEARGVTLKGLKYPLANHTLTSYVPLGVSNEFQGQAASVYVEKGTLVIIWQGTEFKSGKYKKFKDFNNEN